ncbi:MAG TPA: hypothetical protein VMG98_01580, partial [Verrucomicrobiae bacterium]|nr:hypothetical protein [Verrucomicrobiae bacterium]
MKTRTIVTLALGAVMAAAPFAASAKPTLPAAAAIPTPVPTPLTPSAPTVAPGYKAPDIPPANADIVGVTQQPFVGI